MNKADWLKLDNTLGNIVADSAGTNDGSKINGQTSFNRVFGSGVDFDGAVLDFGAGDFSLSNSVKTRDTSINDGDKINGPTSVNGVVGNALDFDGVNDYVSVKDNPALDFGTGDFSLSTWVKTTDKSGIDVILDKRIETSGPVQGYVLFNFNGNLGFQLADRSGWTNYLSNTSIADGEWHQVTVTVDRDNISGGKWYVDGELVDSFNPTGRTGSLDNSGPLTLGRRSDHPSWPGYFDGSLDEVMLFDKSLSAFQVEQNYSDSLSLGIEEKAAWWKLDDTLGNTVVDSAGTNDGTKINGSALDFGTIDFLY